MTFSGNGAFSGMSSFPGTTPVTDSAPATTAGPFSSLPKEEAPKETPAKETPKEAPKEAPKETPAKETPKEEAPAKETPKEEAPAKETPKEEAPAKEAPAKEAPAKEAPKKAPRKRTPRKSPAKKTGTPTSGVAAALEELTKAVDDALGSVSPLESPVSIYATLNSVLDALTPDALEELSEKLSTIEEKADMYSAFIVSTVAGELDEGRSGKFNGFSVEDGQVVIE